MRSFLALSVVVFAAALAPAQSMNPDYYYALGLRNECQTKWSQAANARVQAANLHHATFLHLGDPDVNGSWGGPDTTYTEFYALQGQVHPTTFHYFDQKVLAAQTAYVAGKPKETEGKDLYDPAEAVRLQAEAAFNSGQYSASIPLYQQAIAGFPPAADKYNQAINYFNTAYGKMVEVEQFVNSQ